MIRYWLLVPLFAFSTFAGSVYWWWSVRGDWWVPPPARLPDVPSANVINPPSTLPPTAALDRPLLWSSRRYKSPPTQQDARLADEMAQARLLSVVQSGLTIIAVIRKKDGTVMRYTQNSEPWRIHSFDGRTATMVAADGQQTTLLLQPAPHAR